MINYYQYLEIDDFSPETEIKKAYRNKCKQYHPDQVICLGRKIVEVAEREMAMINKANEILSDREKRAGFDDWLKEARKTKTLRVCKQCGVQFEPEPESGEREICSGCRWRQDSERRVTVVSKAFDPEGLLRTCFVVLHHFVTSSVLQNFSPYIDIIICGEKLRVNGPPRRLEVLVYSKNLFDRITPDSGSYKNPWNLRLNMGRISFSEESPVDSAVTLWNFCKRTFPALSMESCQVSLNNKDYSAYETIINQSILVSMSRISPWTASKLCTRHGRNLVNAFLDPEAGLPDPFLNVLAGPPPRPVSEEIRDVEAQNRKLSIELDNMRRQIISFDDEIRIRNSRIRDLENRISNHDIETSRLKQENSIVTRLYSEYVDLRTENKKLNEELAGFNNSNEKDLAIDAYKKTLEQRNDLICRMQEQLTRLRTDIEHNKHNELMVSQMQDEMETLRRRIEKLQNENSLIPMAYEKIATLEDANKLLENQNVLTTKIQKELDEIKDVMNIAMETYSSYIPNKKPSTNINVWDFVEIFENMAREITQLKKKLPNQPPARKSGSSTTASQPVTKSRRSAKNS